jgi:hypothetical protein
MAYDQIVHPQKRRLLKEIVVAALGRIIELKHVCAHNTVSTFDKLELA